MCRKCPSPGTGGIACFPVGRGAAQYLHGSTIANTLWLLGGSRAYFPPPGSHYLDKCDAPSTEIKCVYKKKMCWKFWPSFSKGKKDLISAWASAWWHLLKCSQITMQTWHAFFIFLFTSTDVLSFSSFTPGVSGWETGSCKQNLDTIGLHNL